MAFPGEKGTLFPEACLTKVPRTVQRREDKLGTSSNLDGSRLPSELLDLPARFIMHEDEVLYFDYGTVRLGRKPELEAPNDPVLVCVGLGWLPGWTFTMSERGLPDIVSAQSSPKAHKQSSDADKKATSGVLGLLYKLQLEGQAPPKVSLFHKQAALDVKDLVYASAKDWDTAVHFHDKHKLLKQTEVYIHLFDGGLGHKYQKDGNVVPFRTPGWPVRTVVHIDPSQGHLIHTKDKKAVQRHLQGDWVAKELEQWVKDASLPQVYVEEVLRDWILSDPGIQLKKPPGAGFGFKRFLGFGPG